MALERPELAECGAFYWRYIHLVPDLDILEYLGAQGKQWHQLLSGLEPSLANYRYAPGKWTVNEVLIHCLDTERIFTYRALALSRGENQHIPGFDQDAYVASADVSERPIASFTEEFASVRHATLSFFRTVSREQSVRSGLVDDKPMSVRSVAYIIAGHMDHHLGILESRYQ